MKKVLILALAIVYGIVSYGQGFGVQVGLNMGSYTESYVIESVTVSQSYKGKIGLYLGINYDLEIKDNMYVSIGGALSQYGGKYVDEDNDVYELTINYLEFPMLFKYGFELSDGMNLFLNAGPVMGLAIGGKEEVTYDNKSYKWDIGITNKVTEDDLQNEMDIYKTFIKRTNLSLRLGGGLNFNKFELGIFYTAGLSNISPWKNGKAKTGLFSVVAGMRF